LSWPINKITSEDTEKNWDEREERDRNSSLTGIDRISRMVLGGWWPTAKG
jgi:hypothetical protein